MKWPSQQSPASQTTEVKFCADGVSGTKFCAGEVSGTKSGSLCFQHAREDGTKQGDNMTLLVALPLSLSVCTVSASTRMNRLQSSVCNDSISNCIKHTKHASGNMTKRHFPDIAVFLLSPFCIQRHGSKKKKETKHKQLSTFQCEHTRSATWCGSRTQGTGCTNPSRRV